MTSNNTSGQPSQKRMNAIEQRLNSIEDKISLIYNVIVGNELDNKTGLLYRLQTIERELDSVVEQNKTFKWISIGIAIGSGALGGGIMNTIIARLL
jgi:hypothetical protein